MLSSALHCAEKDVPILDAAPKLLLACMPKSGSTWLTSLLESHLNLPATRCYLEADRNEQELDPLVLFQSLGKPMLFGQQHLRASTTALRLCRAFSIKVVVLTRSIDDAVVSFFDHLHQESPVASMFYMEREWFQQLDREQALDFLIDHAVPWYLNFIMGWARARESNPDRILPIRYEDLIRKPESTLEMIFRFYGAATEMDVIKIEVKNGLRFNQGRVGRGKEVLSERQRERIGILSSYYPKADLIAAGLGPLHQN